MVESEKNIYAEIFPNPLNIYKGAAGEYCETSMTLKNLTNNYLIFKIWVNIKDIYLVNPSSSFIKPNESKKIIINRKKNEENNSIIKEKFLIKIYVSETILNSDEEVKEMLKNKKYDEKKEQKIRININLN